MGPGQASHTQPEGAAGVAAGDLDAQTVDFGVIATARDAAQAAAHPAADAVVLVVGQLAAEHVVEVRDLGGRAHAPLVLALGEDGVFLGLVEFVLDVTDDLLQHVFHGDQAGDAAVLVDDDGLVVAADAEFAQQHVQALGFGNEDRRADQRAHLDAGFQHAAQQVLGQQDADDVVAVAFVDGKREWAVSMTEATRYGMGWVTSSRSMRERGTMMSATMPSDTASAPRIIW